MSSTNFLDGVTVVVADWLNDINTVAYTALGDGVNIPSTATDVKVNLGLNQVNNTTDLNKPISTATQSALDLKVSQDTATGAAILPSGTTAQRPSGGAGRIRFNNTLNLFEGYNTGTLMWESLGAGGASSVSFSPSGTITATNVQAAIQELDSETQTTLSNKAPVASPVFTGNPTAPTPAASDNDTSIATTAFVHSVASGPAFTASINSQAVGTSLQFLTTTEITDSNSCYVPSTFTPTVAGWYQVNLNIGTNQNDNWANASIAVNGVSTYRASSPGAPSGIGGGTFVAISQLIYLNGTTDYIQCMGSISVGGFSVVSGTFSASLARRN